MAQLGARKQSLEAVPLVPAPVPTPAVEAVKLPMPGISLNPFEDNRDNPFGFFNFMKTFSNAMSALPNLSPVQKLVYLRNYLKGEALNLIESVDMDEKGYDTALERLNNLFLNKVEIHR